MSLFLFECKNFIDYIIETIKKFVFVEGTYAVEFINEILHAYCFEKTEETDPCELYDLTTGPILMLRNYYKNSNKYVILEPQVFYERIFEFLLSSCVEFIRLAKDESFKFPERAKLFKNKAVCMVKSVIIQLHNKLINQVHGNFYILKLSRTITKESL